jgi:hypothetical protein
LATTLIFNHHTHAPTNLNLSQVNAILERREHSSTETLSSAERNSLFLVPALLPGVLMTPVSGLLEACNAGHQNPEPLSRAMWRGLVPRCAREVVFGVGLNQLSDYCEERVPDDVGELI